MKTPLAISPSFPFFFPRYISLGLQSLWIGPSFFLFVRSDSIYLCLSCHHAFKQSALLSFFSIQHLLAHFFNVYTCMCILQAHIKAN